MKTKETKNKWMGIALFYVVAVAIRAVALTYERIDGSPLTFWLWSWAEGIGPCLGALAAILLFKRRFYCSVTGRSILRSALTVALPFAVCFAFNRELSFTLLGFIFYSFLEEVGWRGYLQGELQDLKPVWRVLLVASMWFFWHIQVSFGLTGLFFFALLVFGSWGIGIIARDTRSLVVCACFHTLFNFSVRGYFEFTPAVIAIYVAIIISWHLIWYVPSKKAL